MARGQAQKADEMVRQQQKKSEKVGGRATDVYSSLEPQLQMMAAKPPGFDPADISAMRTGVREGLGGATSGLMGQGMLTQARTRNTAGIAPAMDEAMREAGRLQSSADLGITGENARLKQMQQQAALSSLGGLYGENLGAEQGYMGMGPGTLGARAAGGGWTQGFGDVASGLSSLFKP